MALLNRYDWLDETVRQKFIHELRFIALEVPDADWLDIEEINEILNPDEYSKLIGDVREMLAVRISETLSDWQMNEQGESIADYYGPLEDALERYQKLFEDDKAVLTSIASARADIEVRIAEVGEDEEERPKSFGVRKIAPRPRVGRPTSC